MFGAVVMPHINIADGSRSNGLHKLLLLFLYKMSVNDSKLARKQGNKCGMHHCSEFEMGRKRNRHAHHNKQKTKEIDVFGRFRGRLLRRREINEK